MWMVVYIAQTSETAEKIRSLLQDAGLLVKVRAVNQTQAEKYGCYEILVTESELDAAHNIIIEKAL